MRVRRIQIERWRNLEGIDLVLASDADMVCLVGENGTGKSNLLELIATTAHHLGVTPGLALKRPHPRDRQEPFSVRVTLDVADLVNAEAVSHQAPHLPLDSWDGSITFDAAGRLHGPGETVAPDPNVSTSSTGLYTSWWRPHAGGLEDASQAMSLGNHIVNLLQQRPEVLHLYVDAERVFPPPNVRDEEVLALARQDTQAPGWVRQQAAVLSENLYLQWLRQMLGAQQREQSRYYQLARDAESRGEQIPAPQDPLDDYAGAVRQVLPHLRFVRLDQERRQLIFDAAGIELAYEDLSGGEREVAFLVGQIDRFGMRDGLFLVDEPELHLNAELLRAWLEYLRGTVDAGQVWIATHALEAVEVAGNAATLVCERDTGDRVVRIVSPLGERPVLATLAGLLGAPGFSLVRSRFILIEGDRPGRERERFVQLLEPPATDRFLESGGCGQVLARLAHVRGVATATEQLRIGAIIDRDMRSDAQVADVEALGGFVLPVTEIENLFLYPALVEAIAAQHGLTAETSRTLVRDLADRHAGRWIFERTSQQAEWAEDLAAAAGRARTLTFANFQQDAVEVTKEIARLIPGLNATMVAQRAQQLRHSLDVWERIRDESEALWRDCLGKELLRELPPRVGLSDSEAYEKRATQLWRSGQVRRPIEVQAVRQYIENLPLSGA